MSTPKSACCGADTFKDREDGTRRCKACIKPCSIAPPKKDDVIRDHVFQEQDFMAACAMCFEPIEKHLVAPSKEESSSNCCKAPVIVVGGDEGTNHWECSACNKACDDTAYSESWTATCPCGSREHEEKDCPNIAPPKPVEDTWEGKGWWEQEFEEWWDTATDEQKEDEHLFITMRSMVRRFVEESTSRGIDIGKADEQKRTAASIKNLLDEYGSGYEPRDFVRRLTGRLGIVLPKEEQPI